MWLSFTEKTFGVELVFDREDPGVEILRQSITLWTNVYWIDDRTLLIINGEQTSLFNIELLEFLNVYDKCINSDQVHEITCGRHKMEYYHISELDGYIIDEDLEEASRWLASRMMLPLFKHEKSVPKVLRRISDFM
jgi:hypothetical protein